MNTLKSEVNKKLFSEKDKDDQIKKEFSYTDHNVEQFSAKISFAAEKRGREDKEERAARDFIGGR